MNIFQRYADLEQRVKKLMADCPHKYIIVTGCSRSGTGSASRIFQKAGLQIGHHVRPGIDGVVADVAVPFKCLQDCLVLHQVRHPLKQIASMTTSQWYTWEYIRGFVNIGNGSLLRSCMAAWLEWNKLIQPKAVFRYRIEDMENQWEHICNLIGLPPCPFPVVSTTTHTRAGQYTPVTWKDLEKEDMLLCNQIQNLASYYGYNHVE